MLDEHFDVNAYIKPHFKLFLQRLMAKILHHPTGELFKANHSPVSPLFNVDFFGRSPRMEKPNVNIESRGDRGEHKLVQDFGHQLYS